MATLRPLRLTFPNHRATIERNSCGREATAPDEVKEMKDVSWEVAFRKLNEWRKRGSMVTFGPVGECWDEHGKVISIHLGASGGFVLSADAAMGTASLFKGKEISLVGASFRFSEWEDSPFNEADLGPEEFRSSLEATFPDGRVFVLAEEWPL